MDDKMPKEIVIATKDGFHIIADDRRVNGVEYTRYIRDDLVSPAASVGDDKQEAEYWRARALTAEARYQSSVKILSNIAGYLKPENIQAPDGQTYEFNPSDEVVRAHWNGLCKAIRCTLLQQAAQKE